MMIRQANIFLNGSYTDYSTIVDKTLFTLAADGGVVNALRNGCTPNVILGDGDSLPGVPSQYQKQIHAIPFIHTPDQNFTDFEKSLQFLQDKKMTKVFVYCFQGERVDHMLAGLSAVSEHMHMDIILYTATQQIIKVANTYETRAEQGEIISLIPYPEAADVSTKGFAWELKNANLELGKALSISNQSLDKVIKITYTEGNLFLIRPIK